MERDQFTRTVSERVPVDVDDEGATDATRAVLTTLGERLGDDLVGGLAAQLPDELGTHLTTGDAGQRFAEEEFIARVDQRMETVALPAESATTAVLGTVVEAVDEPERATLVDQFEHFGFEDLLAETDAADGQDRTPGER